MVTVRFCSSYPSDFSQDDPALKIVKFALSDSLKVPNITQEFHRDDTKEACVARISNNLSDIISNWTPLDVQAPHVKFFTITDQSSPVIISSYEPASSTSDTDVLGVCSLYDYDVVVLIILLVVVVWCFFRSYSYLRRKQKQEFFEVKLGHNVAWNTKKETQYSWLLFGMMLDNYDNSEMDRAKKKALSFRILFSLLLFTSFLLHFFFSTSIKTSLVTVDHAVIISTLDDALHAMEAKNVQPKWITYDSMWKNFAEAPAGSVMNKLWHKSHENRTFALGLTNGLETIVRINKPEIILIGQWVTINIAYASLCPIAKQVMDKRRIIMRTTNVLQQISASVYNDRMDKKISKMYHTRVLHTQEGGLLEGILSKFEAPSNLPGDIRPEDIRDCQLNRVQEAHADVPVKAVYDFKYLFALSFLIIAVAVVRLLFEKAASFRRQRKVQCSKQ